MQYPNTIIELDAYFTDENKKKFLKLMNKHFDIEEKDVEIYKANNYAKDSDFAGEIYDQMFKILGEENWKFIKKIKTFIWNFIFIFLQNLEKIKKCECMCRFKIKGDKMINNDEKDLRNLTKRTTTEQQKLLKLFANVKRSEKIGS